MAGLNPEDVDYINAHGTGTQANDPTETRAIRAIELVAALGAVADGVVPPTINHLGPDPECDLNVVPNTAQQRPVRAAPSNSLAFGGLNAVLAVKRFG